MSDLKLATERNINSMTRNGFIVIWALRTRFIMVHLVEIKT